MAVKKFDKLVAEAAQKLSALDFGAAKKLYEQALKQRPGNAAALMGLAMIANHTGAPQQTLMHLQPLLKAQKEGKAQFPPDIQAAIYAQLGLAFEQLGKLHGALECYRQAASYKDSNELRQQIARLEQLIERPEPTQELIQKAQIAQRNRQLDEAIKYYRAALQLNADHPVALHGLGMVFYDQGKLDAALPLVQQAIILEPDRADYYNDLGMIFQRRGELEKAITFHRRALKLDPNFAPAWVNLGVAYKRLEKFDEAVQAYRQALAIRPDMPEVHNNLGNLLRLMGQFDAAKAELEKALALRPDYADAKANLALVLKQMESLAGEPQVESKAEPAPTPSTKARKTGSQVKKNVSTRKR